MKDSLMILTQKVACSTVSRHLAQKRRDKSLCGKKVVNKDNLM